MKNLRLIKGRSYRGYGVMATKTRPGVTVEDETAEALLNTGYFEECAAPAPNSTESIAVVKVVWRQWSLQ